MRINGNYSNLVRVYNENGNLVDNAGKKYDLKPKENVVKDEFTILGNIENSDDENSDSENNENNEKKKGIILN